MNLSWSTIFIFLPFGVCFDLGLLQNLPPLPSESSFSSASSSASSSSAHCCVDLAMEERLRVECRQENERLTAERRSFEDDAEKKWRRHFRSEIEAGATLEAENRRRAENCEKERHYEAQACQRKLRDLKRRTTTITMESLLDFVADHGVHILLTFVALLLINKFNQKTEKKTERRWKNVAVQTDKDVNVAAKVADGQLQMAAERMNDADGHVQMAKAQANVADDEISMAEGETSVADDHAQKAAKTLAAADDGAQRMSGEFDDEDNISSTAKVVDDFEQTSSFGNDGMDDNRLNAGADDAQRILSIENAYCCDSMRLDDNKQCQP